MASEIIGLNIFQTRLKLTRETRSDSMNDEQIIQDTVVEYFRKLGFECLPDKNKWGKFSFSETPGEQKTRQPDVVAYRWEDNGLTLDVRAVECKIKGTHAGVRLALDQAVLYQKHLLWCYIATEVSDENFDYVRKSYGLGYLPVDRNHHSVVRQKILDVFPDMINTKLIPECFTINRQKLVAFDTFMRVFGSEQFQSGFDGDTFFASTKGKIQYHLENNTDLDFNFGLNIE